MIKFFRKIRQHLLTENKFSKYMLYAIGEIILVVIGILIALSINNKNQDRKERTQETIILKQLLSDFNSNLDQLDQKIAMRKGFMSSSKQLFRLIDNPDLRVKDSLDYYLARTLPYATFDPIVNDLASSGELSLVKNPQLKHALTRWSSNIADVKEEEQIWLFYRNELYMPFLIENYQFRTLRNKAFQSNVLSAYSINIAEGTDLYGNDNIGSSYHEEDFNGLLNHPDFEDHLSRCYSINKWANIQSEILRKRIVEIIELIEEEIKS